MQVGCDSTVLDSHSLFGQSIPYKSLRLQLDTVCWQYVDQRLNYFATRGSYHNSLTSLHGPIQQSSESPSEQHLKLLYEWYTDAVQEPASHTNQQIVSVQLEAYFVSVQVKYSLCHLQLWKMSVTKVMRFNGKLDT